jgi:hypothetical protein
MHPGINYYEKGEVFLEQGYDPTVTEMAIIYIP